MTLAHNIIINGKSQPVTAPESWAEITEAQYLALQKTEPDDSTSILSILTGILPNVLKELTDDKFNALFIGASPLFVSDKVSLDTLKRPKYIEVRGKQYSTDIRPEKILNGYMEIIRLKLIEIEAAAKEGEEPNYYDFNSFFIAYALAGQVFTRFDEESQSEVGVFNEKGADELVLEISNMPMVDVFPIGSFFLPRLLAYLGLQRLALQEKMIQMKLRQDQKTSLGLGLFSRWQALLKMTGQRRNST